MRRRQRGLMRRIKAVLIKTRNQCRQVHYFRYSQISYAANPLDFKPIVAAMRLLYRASENAEKIGDPYWLEYHEAADWLRDTFELYGEEDE